MKGNKNFKKDRIKTGVLLSALIASACLFFVFIQIEKKALFEGEKVKTFMLNKDMKAGMEINFTEDVKEEEVLVEMAPVDYLKDSEGAKILKVDATKGTILTESICEIKDEVLANFSKPVVAGIKADDFFQAVGGILRKGDKVNIYYATDEAEVLTLFKKAFVIDTFDSQGKTIDKWDDETKASRINLLMEESDVEKLYESLEKGSLRVVKVYE